MLECCCVISEKVMQIAWYYCYWEDLLFVVLVLMMLVSVFVVLSICVRSWSWSSTRIVSTGIRCVRTTRRVCWRCSSASCRILCWPNSTCRRSQPLRVSEHQYPRLFTGFTSKVTNLTCAQNWNIAFANIQRVKSYVSIQSCEFNLWKCQISNKNLLIRKKVFTLAWGGFWLVRKSSLIYENYYIQWLLLLFFVIFSASLLGSDDFVLFSNVSIQRLNLCAKI